MKVFLTGVGSRGDIQPLIALALGLRAAGHEARLCATSNGRAMAEAAGIPFIDAGTDIEALLKSEPDLVQKSPLSSARRLRALLLEAIDKQFEVHKRELPWADLAVGAGLVNAPSSVAAALKIPYRFAIYCAQAIPSRLHGPYSLRAQWMPAWLNQTLWHANDLVLKQVAGAAMNKNRAALDLPKLTSVTATLTPPGQLIFAADPELSPPPLDYDPALPITGPWLLPAAGAIAPPLQDFLDKGPKPIYLGFGSMPDAEPAETTRLVLAAAERAKVRLIVSAGWAGLGDAALPATCFAVGETPHALLFPRCAGVVHHGGAGTVATAARAGVPQLIVPHVMDQHYWGERLFRAGVGIKPLPRRALTIDSLARSLDELNQASAAREKAQALAPRLLARDGVTAAIELLAGINV